MSGGCIVRQLPTAAAQPVRNPLRRGRYPAGVRSLITYRLARDAKESQEAAQSALTTSTRAKLQQEAGEIPPVFDDVLLELQFQSGMLLTLARNMARAVEALRASEHSDSSH